VIVWELQYEAALSALRALLATSGANARGAVWKRETQGWCLLAADGADQALLAAMETSDPRSAHPAGLFTWHEHANGADVLVKYCVWSSNRPADPTLAVARHGALVRLVAEWPRAEAPPASAAADGLQLLLIECEWNVALVARRLGCTRATVYNRMRRHGVARKRLQRSGRRAQVQA
jgi:hypothetical protein